MKTKNRGGRGQCVSFRATMCLAQIDGFLKNQSQGPVLQNAAYLGLNLTNSATKP